MKLSELAIITPATFSETNRILGKAGNRKGFAPDSVVYLHARNISSMRNLHRSVEVQGGTAENPVRIYVESGFNTIRVLTGHVIIRSVSSAGNVITAAANTVVDIESDATSKVTVEGAGKVTFTCGSTENRLRDFTVHGVEVK